MSNNNNKKKDRVSAERYPGSRDMTDNTGAYMGFYEKTEETGWERTSSTTSSLKQQKKKME